MGHVAIFLGLMLPAQAADTDFGDKLESPSSEFEVVSVAAVGILVIEDREDRVRGFVDDGVVGDVDAVVGVVREDVCPRSIKGRRAAARYLSSASSPIAVARSISVRIRSVIAFWDTGTGWFLASTTVHASIP
jgi:hypothetical protein